MAIDPADEYNSPYVYVGNSPTNFIDKNGRWTDPPTADDIKMVFEYGLPGAINNIENALIVFGSGLVSLVSDVKMQRLVVKYEIDPHKDGMLANMTITKSVEPCS